MKILYSRILKERRKHCALRPALTFIICELALGGEDLRGSDVYELYVKLWLTFHFL